MIAPYEKCKAFVLELGPILFGDRGFHEVISNIENTERRSLTAANKGIRMAVADIIEATSRLSHDKVKEIDIRLMSVNIPTLTEMRAASATFVKRILNKNKIESEDEFFALRGIAESGIIKDEVTLETIRRRLRGYEDI